MEQNHYLCVPYIFFNNMEGEWAVALAAYWQTTASFERRRLQHTIQEGECVEHYFGF